MLHSAALTPLGRIPTASNATLVCRLAPTDTEGDGANLVVYKPIRGEAPLMDFPDGTLADREYASYVIDQALGWNLIPQTCVRDGPLGRGMVQRWVGADPTSANEDDDATTDQAVEPPPVVDLFPADQVPSTWRHILDAEDEDGQPLSLAHADDHHLLRMAVLDVVINNADRKGGHILTAPDGHLYGVDHGICLHQEPKLRTVLWGWAGEEIPGDLIADVAALRDRLADGEPLTPHLTGDEIAALWRRCDDLIAEPVMPRPKPRGLYGYPPIPWPPW